MTLAASVMMIGGTPKSATPMPLISADRGAAGEDAAARPRAAAGSGRRQSSVIRIAARVQHPGHRQVDAAADDDEGLAERDDADEGRQHDDRAQVARPRGSPARTSAVTRSSTTMPA